MKDTERNGFRRRIKEIYDNTNQYIDDILRHFIERTPMPNYKLIEKNNKDKD